MLRLGTTATPFDGPVEVTGDDPPEEGWIRGGILDEGLHVPGGAVMAVSLPAPTTDDPVSEFEELIDRAEGDGTVAVVTGGGGGFGTLGDLALLHPVRGFVPILDWETIGGIPSSIQAARAVIEFARDNFDEGQVSPFRTRLDATRIPELSALAAACEMADVEVILVLDGVAPRSSEAPSRSRRLGSGMVDLDEVTVFADGERWVPGDSAHPIRLSNIDKPFFPEGLTKGDLIEFYAGIAPVLLPHLRGRPISMSRYPDGIEGPSFYEKRAPGHQPDWMRTAKVESDSMGGEIDFLLAADRPSLMWFANMGCIEVHPFHS